MANPGRGSKTFPPGKPPKEASDDADWDLPDSSPFDRPTLIPDVPPEELSAGIVSPGHDEDSGVFRQRIPAPPPTPSGGLPFDPIPTPPETRRITDEEIRAAKAPHATPPSIPRPRSQMPTLHEEDPLAFDFTAPKPPKAPSPPVARKAEPLELDLEPAPTQPKRRQNAITQPDPLASERDSESRVAAAPARSEQPTLPPPASESSQGTALNLVSTRRTERNTTRNRTAPRPVDQPTDMRDRFALGDFSGALVVAESILEADPSDAEAARYAESCRERLRQMYASRLGSLARVPRVIVPPDQVRWLSLDHRSGFILSCVDGYSTIEEILDVSGMAPLDALRVLYELLQQRIIAVG